MEHELVSKEKMEYTETPLFSNRRWEGESWESFGFAQDKFRIENVEWRRSSFPHNMYIWSVTELGNGQGDQFSRPEDISSGKLSGNYGILS